MINPLTFGTALLGLYFATQGISNEASTASQGGMNQASPPVVFLPNPDPAIIGSMTSHGGSIGIITMTIHSEIERRPYRGPWDSRPPTFER